MQGADWCEAAGQSELRAQKPQGLGSRYLGFRGLGFRGLGFRVLGFRVFGFRVYRVLD